MNRHLLSAGDRDRIADRFERCRTRHQERAAALERAAHEVAQQRPISPKWISYQLGQALDDECILLEDTVGNAINVQNYCPSRVPESFFKNSGTSGGWGVSAGFGATPPVVSKYEKARPRPEGGRSGPATG